MPTILTQDELLRLKAEREDEVEGYLEICSVNSTLLEWIRETGGDVEGWSKCLYAFVGYWIGWGLDGSYAEGGNRYVTVETIGDDYYDTHAGVPYALLDVFEWSKE